MFIYNQNPLFRQNPDACPDIDTWWQSPPLFEQIFRHRLLFFIISFKPSSFTAGDADTATAMLMRVVTATMVSATSFTIKNLIAFCRCLGDGPPAFVADGYSALRYCLPLQRVVVVATAIVLSAMGRLKESGTM